MPIAPIGECRQLACLCIAASIDRARAAPASWVGGGGGLLARQLRAAGFAARGVDASPPMIELVRDYEPGAKFEQFCKLVPPSVPSGIPVLDFEECPGDPDHGREAKN